MFSQWSLSLYNPQKQPATPADDTPDGLHNKNYFEDNMKNNDLNSDKPSVNLDNNGGTGHFPGTSAKNNKCKKKQNKKESI